MGFSIKINHRVGQPTVGFSINGDVAGGKRERGGMHQRWDFLWYVKWGYIIISQYVKHLIYLKYVGGMSCERKCSYSTGETSCSTILTVRPWLTWFSWFWFWEMSPCWFPRTCVRMCQRRFVRLWWRKAAGLFRRRWRHSISMFNMG